MSSMQEQRLARFVDRESEMKSFCRMLDEHGWPRPIVMVWGDGGMGKTALLLKMWHECSSRQLLKAEVIWTDTRNYDYLAVMRKTRDDLGVENFVGFTKLVNSFTDPKAPPPLEVIIKTAGQIDVARNMEVKDQGKVGSVTGMNIENLIIKDLMLVTPRADLGIPDNERMARLTDQFIQELNEVACKKRIVIFLDAVEKAADATQRWIWGEFLGALRDDRLSNVNFVIGGRNKPAVDDVWRPYLEEQELRPLEAKHIAEYLIKRNVDPGDAAREQVVEFIIALTGGNPLKVANAVEYVSRMREKDKDKVQ